MKKVPPSEKLRKEIDEILSWQVGKDEDVLGLLIKRSLKMMFHKILEKEVRDYLGRDHYERGAGNREGYRNGYETKRLKTAEGEIELAAPQLRDTEECYRSGFLGRIDSLSPQLKQLVVEMYVRGLSASNIRNKLPQEAIDEVLPQIKSAYYQTEEEIARLYASKLVDTYAGKYPSAIKCFQEDYEACLQHMHFPAGHQKQLTTTNLLERSFEEQKRRTKVIPRFFDEKSCLKLVYATMVRVSQKWRPVKMSDYDLTILRNLRKLYGWEENDEGYISKKAAT